MGTVHAKIHPITISFDISPLSVKLNDDEEQPMVVDTKAMVDKEQPIIVDTKAMVDKEKTYVDTKTYLYHVNPEYNKHLVITKRFALGVIDVQNDFCKGGSLAINEANFVIGPINILRHIFNDLPTFVSMDYHPYDHMSFARTHGVAEFSKKTVDVKLSDTVITTVEQDMWPAHCVSGTTGSQLHADLIVYTSDHIVYKGTKSHIESYSAFGDEYNNLYENTQLSNWLSNHNITDIILTGVATDYCVFNTAMDAIRYGYKVHLIMSCMRGVKDDTTEAALNTMTTNGVIIYSNINEFIRSNC